MTNTKYLVGDRVLVTECYGNVLPGEERIVLFTGFIFGVGVESKHTDVSPIVVDQRYFPNYTYGTYLPNRCVRRLSPLESLARCADEENV